MIPVKSRSMSTPTLTPIAGPASLSMGRKNVRSPDRSTRRRGGIGNPTSKQLQTLKPVSTLELDLSPATHFKAPSLFKYFLYYPYLVCTDNMVLLVYNTSMDTKIFTFGLPGQCGQLFKEGT